MNLSLVISIYSRVAYSSSALHSSAIPASFSATNVNFRALFRRGNRSVTTVGAPKFAVCQLLERKFSTERVSKSQLMLTYNTLQCTFRNTTQDNFLLEYEVSGIDF